jgi:pilus assembly protein Flp/PilA
MTFNKAIRKARKGRKAQGMTEYIIIVALIAIAAIGVVTLFGNNLRRIFGTANDALAGEQDQETKAKKTRDQLLKSKQLNKFNKDNKPE